MYFYRNQGVDLHELMKSIEQGDPGKSRRCPREAISEEQEHISAKVPLEREDIVWAESSIEDFQALDDCITCEKLAKYLATFRNSMESEIIRYHGQILDQRRFDAHVVLSAQASFVDFASLLAAHSPAFTNSNAEDWWLSFWR